MTWRPRLRAEADLFNLPLDAEQAFLLSRLDGTVSTEDVAQLTGVAPERLQALLGHWQALGILEPREPAARVGPPGPAVPPEPVLPPGPAEPPEPIEPPEPAVLPAPPGPPEDPAAGLLHRSLFEQHLHAHPAEERAARVRTAEEPELSAYCFDPAPQVILGLFQNPRTGLQQARLVAAHHRSGAGLEALAAVHAFSGDPGVRRALLQNPVLPLSLFRRLWAPQRLQAQFQVAISHDLPEPTRAMARDLVRATFGQRAADEKTEFILKTEGRCLNLLTGIPLDGHTTQLLCRRTYISTLLIQNIARWSAAPPPLIAHLLRQDTVRRNPQLKLMLERHPNAGA